MQPPSPVNAEDQPSDDNAERPGPRCGGPHHHRGHRGGPHGGPRGHRGDPFGMRGGHFHHHGHHGFGQVLAKRNPSDLCAGDAEVCLDIAEATITLTTASIIAANTEVDVEEFALSPFLSADLQLVSIF